MNDETSDAAVIRRLASEMFNRTWELLDLHERSAAQDAEMAHASHGSRALWERVGGPKEHAIGDWQVARVHATLGWGASARVFAEQSLALVRAHDLGAFLEGEAHESVARAAAVLSDREAFDEHRRAAEAMVDRTEDDEERAVLRADVESLRFADDV